jgi:PAS domain S-box-containing protein
MPAPLAKLLIVDDETAQMTALCKTLQLEGYETVGFSSANQALETLRAQSFDLVLTDMMMPEMDGITLLRNAFEIDSNLVGIVMTGHGTIGTAVEALKAGALDYILKPFKLSAVLPVLARALNVRNLRMENIQLRGAVSIYELSMAIAFAFDRDTVLQKVMDAALQQDPTADVSIMLPSEDGLDLDVALARGRNAEYARTHRVPLDDDLRDWIRFSGALISNPVELLEIQSKFAKTLHSAPGGVSVPMLTGGKLIGILNFDPGPHQQVTTGQLKALNIVAGTAASALEGTSLLEQVRAAEQRYRRLAENAPDIVFRLEIIPQRRFTYVSPMVTAVTGYSPEEHYADPDVALKILHPDDHPLLESLLRGDVRKGGTVTMRWVHKNGKVIWIEQRSVIVRDPNGKAIAIEGIARDISERRQLEDQLRHSQKMDAIGRLTAGVAHDFNNLLTVINGYSDLSLRELPTGNPVRRKIDEVRKAGDQAAALTRQLLAFGRKQVSQSKIVDVNAAVKANLNILKRVIGEDIELVTVLDPELHSVNCDEGQVEQVLLNLAVNSRDAMSRGGRLTIQTANAAANDAGADQVMVSVSDTGCGMDAATQLRVFEPFFTTKESGRGTGLGLAIVSGIVKQHGGKIELESKPGEGTTFKMYLPGAEKAAPRVALQTAGEARGGSETILIVEDDAAVRDFVSTILEDAGYRVVAARHGNHALEIFQQPDSKFGLVITDLVMPHMNGPVLVEKLRSLDAGVKVLYTSGYADDAVARHGDLDPEVPFIRKPYDSEYFLQKVRETLDVPIAQA